MSRIVFFVSSMHGGGAERVAALLCNHWVTQGHEVLLVPTFSGRGECLYPLDERVRLEYLADRVGTTRKTLWSMGRRLLAMRRMVQGFNADAVVSFLSHVNVAALIATRGLGVRVMVSERIHPPAMAIAPIWMQLRRWTYPWASAVVMQTQQGVHWLKQTAPTSRACVIPNPCAFPLPDGEPRVAPGTIVTDDRRILLGVGRLEEQKGFPQLIEAFANLAEGFPTWDLVILGEGSERPVLEEQMAAAGLSHRVHLPGRVGNLAEWYRRADLYAMSSRFEGFPNTLMEAMAHAVPAVSFDCDSGPREIIRSDVDGLLIDPDEGVEGLSAALGSLMSNSSRRLRMGRAARETRDRFSIEMVSGMWLRALRATPESGIGVVEQNTADTIPKDSQGDA